ncbi:MAG: hypothetical protein ACHQDY_01495 [Solirubrobacterales bacterium]
MSDSLPKLFSDCLLWLAGAALDSFQDGHHSLIAGMNPIGEEDLEWTLYRDTDQFVKTRGLVVLPPIDSRVPLLHLAHGTEGDRSILRMTLVIVGADECGPHATAWRFEAPEGPGQHCYWHCQPVRQLRHSQAPPLERLPDWYFDDVPTLPLAASNPDELLVALLVSVYGYREFGRRQRQDFQDRLQVQLAALDRA